MRHQFLKKILFIYLFTTNVICKGNNRNFCNNQICSKNDMTVEKCQEKGGSIAYLDGLKYCVKNITNVLYGCDSNSKLCTGLGEEWKKSIPAEYCHESHRQLLTNLSYFGSFWTNIKAETENKIWKDCNNKFK